MSQCPCRTVVDAAQIKHARCNNLMLLISTGWLHVMYQDRSLLLSDYTSNAWVCCCCPSCCNGCVQPTARQLLQAFS
jgi:hypothetical protein